MFEQPLEGRRTTEAERRQRSFRRATALQRFKVLRVGVQEVLPGWPSALGTRLVSVLSGNLLS